MPNAYFVEVLKGLEFICEKDNCDIKNIRYNDVISHRETCFIEEIPCLFDCQDGMTYKGKE